MSFGAKRVTVKNLLLAAEIYPERDFGVWDGDYILR
jgi:hypothetical protein